MPVDKINLYSLMYATAADIQTTIDSDIPHLDEKGQNVKRLMERLLYMRRNLSRLAEPLALEIMEEVLNRTPPELRPDIYRVESDVVPFRIKEGQFDPLSSFDTDRFYEGHDGPSNLPEIQKLHDSGHLILEFVYIEQPSDYEVYLPETPEQLFIDWRRAPQGHTPFVAECIYKARDRWFTSEAPGEGDTYSDKEILPLLLTQKERILYGSLYAWETET